MYVGGFDKHLAFEDLENFLTKYGKIKAMHRQFDNVRLQVSCVDLNIERKK